MPSYTQFAVLTQIRHHESVDKVPAPFDTANIAGKKFNVKLRLTDAFFGSKVYPGLALGIRDDIEKTDPVLRPDAAMTKRLIMQYGAVEVSYFVPDQDENATEDPYLNPKTHAFYYDDKEKNVESNHVVAIIGWDDDFSKDNFNSAHKPSKNGAWLVRNNWGTYWPNPADYESKNPDGGYFWLS